MTRMPVAVSACAALLLGSAAAAYEGPPCGMRKTMIEKLATHYDEATVSGGLTHSGDLVEVLAAEGGKTWSIIVTSPRGISCLVAAGEGWREFTSPPEGPGT